MFTGSSIENARGYRVGQDRGRDSFLEPATAPPSDANQPADPPAWWPTRCGNILQLWLRVQPAASSTSHLAAPFQGQASSTMPLLLTTVSSWPSWNCSSSSSTRSPPASTRLAFLETHLHQAGGLWLLGQLGILLPTIILAVSKSFAYSTWSSTLPPHHAYRPAVSPVLAHSSRC